MSSSSVPADLETLKKSLKNISTSIERITSENEMIYEFMNKLAGNTEKDLYKFESDMSGACIEYLKNLNTFQMDQSSKLNLEKSKEEKADTISFHNELYSSLDSNLKKIMDEYKNILKTEGNEDDTKKVSNFVYNDGYKSKQLNCELVGKYPGSYYYKEYMSDRRTEKGDIYIDYDHMNEDLLVKYMNDDNSLIKDIEKINVEGKLKLLDDLSFLELPVKVQFVGLLGYNKDLDMVNNWKTRKLVHIEGKAYPSISKDLRKNGKIEEMYKEKLLKDIHLDSKSRLFSIDITMQYVDIIENYLEHDRNWNSHLLLIEQLRCEDVINEMIRVGIDVDEEDKKKIEKAWMSLRRIYVNNQYNESIDGCLRNGDHFVSAYENNINTEQHSGDHYLYVNIMLKCVPVLEAYLDNQRQWNKQFLHVPQLKYTDLRDDLSHIRIVLNKEEKQELINEWMSTRQIYVNNDYRKSIDKFLKQSDQFISVYEQFIEGEQNDGDEYLYVNVSLNYIDVIVDYITNKNQMNFNLVKAIKGYQYDLFLKEFELMGIELDRNDIDKLKELDAEYLMFPESQILNKSYDQYLQKWIGRRYEWKCIYRASEHGYTSKSFHEYCDDVGPTIIVIRDQNNNIFGGYTTKSWSGMNLHKFDNDAFIFTLSNYYGISPVHFKVLKDEGGIKCSLDNGPIFGSDDKYDIFISSEGMKCNEYNSCSINNDGEGGFECNSNYKSSLLSYDTYYNSNSFSVSDYEVFSISNLNLYMKEAKLSLEIKGMEIIPKPLTNPSRLLNGTRIVDSFYDQYLSEWLGSTYEMSCIYRASEHEYSAKSFHEYCDDKSPTLIVIRSYNGWIFGGYTSQSWSGNKLKYDRYAFIFTLRNPHRVPPTCYRALSRSGYIICHPIIGPTFSGEDDYADIFIGLNRNCNESSSCFIGNNGTNGYECDPQYKNSLFVNTAGPDETNFFSVSDYEVFCYNSSTCNLL